MTIPVVYMGKDSCTKSDSCTESFNVDIINIAYQVWIRGNPSLTLNSKSLLICHYHFNVGIILLLESKQLDLILSIRLYSYKGAERDILYIKTFSVDFYCKFYGKGNSFYPVHNKHKPDFVEFKGP